MHYTSSARTAFLILFSSSLLTTAGCNIRDKLKDAVDEQAANAAAGAICRQDSPPDACSQECGTTTATFCPTGFYCGAAQRCTADCTSSDTQACGTSQVCSFNGHCSDAASNNNNNVCASVKIDAKPVTPYVHILIDRSGSMDVTFQDGLRRWDYVKKLLINYPANNGGLIKANESKVKFSLSTYTGSGSGDQCTGGIPTVETFPSQSNFFNALVNSWYPASSWQYDTPTGDSIDYLMTNYISTIPDDGNPHVILLATDGEPDRCEDLNPQADDPDHPSAIEVEGAITRAYGNAGRSVKTFVVFVGNDADQDFLKPHLQRISNLGIGKTKTTFVWNGPGQTNQKPCWELTDSSTAAQCWKATDGAGLTAAFDQIINNQISCDIKLNGEIKNTSIACAEGKVTINGTQSLTCNDLNGWSIVDSQHIRIDGTACTTLKDAANPTVEATFPCGAVDPVVI